MQEQPTKSAQTGAHYAFKPALMGAAHQFELTDGGLSWRLAGRSGVWPYTDISAIRLSYRPVTMQADRFRADIHTAGGRCELQIWPHQVHVFQALPRLSPEAVKAMKHVARFIDTSMRDNGIEAISGKAG